MRIKSIEFENFRNFKDRGKIICSTDGRVTIIYGKNGDGKTTLHQLLHWIFYGSVNFNKTTNDLLYNITFEANCPAGSQFEVMGRIEFEHEGSDYLLRRTQYYEKTMFDGSKPTGMEFELQKKDADNNWKTVQEKPEEAIEQLLPSGLSEYFFFDGESMIADLKVKSEDSAKKLRASLYSMFDLDIWDMAIDHIGDTKHKPTVIGKLYFQKGDDVPGSELSITKANIEKVQSIIDKTTTKLSDLRAERDEKKRSVKELSELIGSTKSRTEFEKQRKHFQKQQEDYLKYLELEQSMFGDEVMASYPRLLISKAIRDAKAKIQLKIDNSTLPTGVNKALIEYLLDQNTTTCICGNPLCDADKEHIRAYLSMLPPKSFSSLYHEFSTTVENWGKKYNRKKTEDYIRRALNDIEQAEHCEEQIREIDAEQKKSADIEKYVTARQNAEARIVELEQLITAAEVDLRKANAALKKYMADFDKLSKDNQKAAEAQRRIDIMEEVKAHFVRKLTEASDTYSKRLQDNIQELLDTMLTSKRKVSVSSDFAVRVFDSYENESKSEGQFAIVSFAYIGGILRMLQSEDHLAGKEYPLILDGPFSKLDMDQRQNVVDTIPSFAPQVILFSKDSLQDVFSPEQIGRVWTISSNAEKNVATVKEGYHWN